MKDLQGDKVGIGGLSASGEEPIHGSISHMNSRFRCPWLPLFLADFAAITAAYFVTWSMRFHSDTGARFFAAVNKALLVDQTIQMGPYLKEFYIVSAPRIILLLTATLVLLYALRDLYAGRRFLRPRPMAWNVILANAMALLLFYAYFYLSRNTFHPRSLFGSMLVLNVGFTIVFRSCMTGMMGRLRASGWDRCRVILAGSGEAVQRVEALAQAHLQGYDVVARIPANDGDILPGHLQAVARQCPADMIVLAVPDLSVSEIMKCLEVAGECDVAAKVLSDKMDILVDEAGLEADRIRGVPLLHFEAPSAAARWLRIRLAAAFVLSVLMLVLAAPFMAIIAFLILVTSKGPAMYVQERIGVDRRSFRMLKFRTMYAGADELQAEVEELNESGSGLFKIRRDPRVTPVGRFLRRFSLDELPQLVNVLRGEMTLVGPRPLPRRDFENYYEDWHYARHEGLPGLTCLWQVSGRSDVGFHDMCILDVYYLRNQGWILDVKILLKTVWVVLFAKGAY